MLDGGNFDIFWGVVGFVEFPSIHHPLEYGGGWREIHHIPGGPWVAHILGEGCDTGCDTLGPLLKLTFTIGGQRMENGRLGPQNGDHRSGVPGARSPFFGRQW